MLIKKMTVALIIAALAFLSFSKPTQNYYWDISQNHLNSLSHDSKQLLAQLDAPLILQVYSPNINVLNAYNNLLTQYSKYSPQISVELKQTILEPSVESKLKISSEHNIVATYKNRQQAIDIKPSDLTETKISNLIQELINNTQRWLVFLNGHQETDPLDTSPLGLNTFSQLFTSQGMHVAQLNLLQTQQIPHNVDAIIVVNPQTELLDIETKLLNEYLTNGGKLLWFTEPASKATKFLTAEFGLQLAPGVAIDPDSTNLGSPHPALKIITTYPKHAIVQDIKSATIFPWSGHLQIKQQSNAWQPSIFLNTSGKTWTYTGNEPTANLQLLSQQQGQVGPLNIGIALQRAKQNAIVIADSSFISNKYISLFANSQLTNNIVSWVLNDAPAFTFSHTATKDLSYQPNNWDLFVYRYGFTLLLPLLLIFLGFYLQPRRSLAEPSI